MRASTRDTDGPCYTNRCPSPPCVALLEEMSLRGGRMNASRRSLRGSGTRCGHRSCAGTSRQCHAPPRSDDRADRRSPCAGCQSCCSIGRRHSPRAFHSLERLRAQQWPTPEGRFAACGIGKLSPTVKTTPGWPTRCCNQTHSAHHLTGCDVTPLGKCTSVATPPQRSPACLGLLFRGLD